MGAGQGNVFNCLSPGFMLTLSREHPGTFHQGRSCAEGELHLCEAPLRRAGREGRGRSSTNQQPSRAREGWQQERRCAESRSWVPDLNQTLRQLSFKHSSLQGAFGFPSSPPGESVARYSSGLCSRHHSAAVNPLDFQLISAA